jgi:hypothetical protein
MKQSKCRFDSAKLGLYLILCVLALAYRTAYAETSTNPLFGYQGINISLNQSTKPEDIAKIKSWGANCLRLVLNTDPHIKNPRQYDGNVFDNDNKTLSTAYLSRIDAVVSEAKRDGIKIILDMHTFPGHEDGLIWCDGRYWDELTDMWKTIATHYTSNDTVVGYDLLNEPNVLDSLKSEDGSREEITKQMAAGKWTFPKEWRNTPRDYFQRVTKIATAINEIDPSKVIVVEGFGLLGNPVSYHWMEPIHAKNIVYSFHFYIPHSFSHNGVNKNPATDAKYVSGKTKFKLIAALGPVLEFAKAHHAAFYVGEVGLSPYTDGHGATDWLNDAFGLFESNQWPWTYWAYASGWSPEDAVVNGKKVRSNSSERLEALKKYWSGNHLLNKSQVTPFD